MSRGRRLFAVKRSTRQAVNAGEEFLRRPPVGLRNSIRPTAHSPGSPPGCRLRAMTEAAVFALGPGQLTGCQGLLGGTRVLDRLGFRSHHLPCQSIEAAARCPPHVARQAVAGSTRSTPLRRLGQGRRRGGPPRAVSAPARVSSGVKPSAPPTLPVGEHGSGGPQPAPAFQISCSDFEGAAGRPGSWIVLPQAHVTARQAPMVEARAGRPSQARAPS